MLGGTVASTVLGIFMVPVFFLLIRSWFKSQSRHEDAAEPRSNPFDQRHMTHRHPFKPLAVALACALLTGCNLAPRYQAPSCRCPRPWRRRWPRAPQALTP